MSRWITLGIIGAAAVGLAAGVASETTAAAPAATAGPPLAHMVFFALKDRSAESKARFVASCQTHLTGHEGATYFSVGTIAEDVVEGPSVRDFDVALHVVFSGKAARDAYLVHPRHVAFVEENKPHFGVVRVFDSYLAAAKP